MKTRKKDKKNPTPKGPKVRDLPARKDAKGGTLGGTAPNGPGPRP